MIDKLENKEILNSEELELETFINNKCWEKGQSVSPLAKLRRGLIINTIWGVFISLLYVYILWAYRYPTVQVAILVVLAFTIWVIIGAYQILKETNNNQVADKPLLVLMKQYHSSIERWMRIQQRMALFIYPISITGGFLLGGVIGSGLSPEAFLGQPYIWLALVICIAILVPASYYLAKWLFKITFGTDLKILQTLIGEMENPE